MFSRHVARQLGPICALALSATAHATPTTTSHEFVNFNNERHLRAVNVLPAWQLGLTGQGVTVAVVDSGVDLSHPDLVGSFASGARNFVNGGGVPSDDFTSHGTLVTGLITGNFNDAGVIGIAYDARVLPLKAFDGPRGGGVEVLNAIDFAAARSDVRIINLSLGGPLLGPSELSTVQRAASRNKLLVMAAGNDGSANPDFPARLAPQLAGRGIVVGALGDNGDIARFSNRAGETRDFFVLAPGVDIWSTTVGGSFAPVNGTSFSTAYVSGAAALLAQQFPNLATEEIAQILLLSATDLGPPGADTTYGRGQLNIGAALQPIGELVVPTPTAGPIRGATVAGKSLRVAPAMAAALSAANTGLDQTLTLDRFDRGYMLDLQALIRTRSAHRDLGSLSAAGHEDVVIAVSPTQQLSFGLRWDRPVRFGDDDAALSDPTVDTHGWQLPSSAPKLRLSGNHQRWGYVLAFNQHAARDVTRAGFLGNQTLRSPFLGFSDREHRFQLGWQPNRWLRVRSGWVDHNDDAHAQSDSRALFVDTDWAVSNRALVTLRLSHLSERGALFGGSPGGSFSVDTAHTRAAGITVHYRLSDRLALIGRADWGYTRIEDSATSLLRDFSDVGSEAFGLGLVAHNLFGVNGEAGLSVSRPLRIRHGRARLTVPYAMDIAENVFFEDRQLDLSPPGHELDFDAYYVFRPWAHSRLGTHMLIRRHPLHDDGRGLAVTLMATFQSVF